MEYEEGLLAESVYLCWGGLWSEAEKVKVQEPQLGVWVHLRSGPEQSEAVITAAGRGRLPSLPDSTAELQAWLEA